MKSIRGDFRGSKGISLFAFQDVIMSVTGVVIVIALILALQIDKVRVPGSPLDPSDLSTDEGSRLHSPQDLRELELQVSELSERMRQLLVTNRKEESKNEINADIKDLESRIKRLVTLKSSKTDESVESTLNSSEHLLEIAKIKKLKTNLEDDLKKLNQKISENSELGKDMRNIEIKLKEDASAVTEARLKENDLVLIPELNKSTKEPIIVDVRDNGLVISRLDSGTVTGLVKIHNFSSCCRKLKPSEHYFVFFFRPSGTRHFDELCKVAKEARFEIGYDAIEERANLKMGDK